MRMLDVNANMTLSNLILYLKIEEAKELYGALDSILSEKNYSNHMHINDASYERELTVLLYDEMHVESLDERSKRVISDDA